MSGGKRRSPDPAPTDNSMSELTDRELDAIPTDEDVDESLEETFPCSDPPSWMSVKRVGSPRRIADRMSHDSARGRELTAVNAVRGRLRQDTPEG
jgi:hypothetical protein